MTSQPHRGTRVARIPEQQAQDVRDIRVMFEEYVARRTAGRLDAEHARLLTDDVARLRLAVDKGDIAAFRGADMSFHRHVCAAAGNDALTRLWRVIESSLWDLHVLGDPRYDGGWGALAEHHAELWRSCAPGIPRSPGRCSPPTPRARWTATSPVRQAWAPRADSRAGRTVYDRPARSGPSPGAGAGPAGAGSGFSGHSMCSDMAFRRPRTVRHKRVRCFRRDPRSSLV